MKLSTLDHEPYTLLLALPHSEALDQLRQDEPASGGRWSHYSGSTARHREEVSWNTHRNSVALVLTDYSLGYSLGSHSVDMLGLAYT